MNGRLLAMVLFLSTLTGVAMWNDPVNRKAEDVVVPVRDCGVSTEQLDRISGARYTCHRFDDGTRMLSRAY